MAWTRRTFLEASVAVPAGLVSQGLGDFLRPTIPCTDDKPTPAARPDTPFSADTVQKTVLVAPVVNVARLTLTGFVVGLKCGGITGARVDVWHADARGVNAAGATALRAYQWTDRMGKFEFTTNMPGAAAGKPRVINVRVRTTTPGTVDLTTVLFFPDDTFNQQDPRFVPARTMKMTPAAQGYSARFDVLLDL